MHALPSNWDFLGLGRMTRLAARRPRHLQPKRERSSCARGQEPLSRNLFGLLRELGDAEIAALYGARPLIVDHTRQPQVSGPPPARAGRRSGAAPGAITTPEKREVDAEVKRSRALLASAGVAARIELVAAEPLLAEVSRQALERLFAQMKLAIPAARPVRLDIPIEVPTQRQRR